MLVPDFSLSWSCATGHSLEFTSQLGSTSTPSTGIWYSYRSLYRRRLERHSGVNMRSATWVPVRFGGKRFLKNVRTHLSRHLSPYDFNLPLSLVCAALGQRRPLVGTTTTTTTYILNQVIHNSTIYPEYVTIELLKWFEIALGPDSTIILEVSQAHVVLRDRECIDAKNATTAVIFVLL